MRKKLFCFFILFILSLLFVSCKKEINNKEFTIVTSFYPVYISTINITKDVPNVRVVNLTPPTTGCLHDYSLTTDDMKNLSSADILVINGAGMESFMDKIVKQMADLKVVDSAENIELIKVGGHHEHNNEDEPSEERKHSSEEEEFNPHVWLSVTNAIEQVKNISSGLCKYDPEHKDLYEKNTETYVAKLKELKSKMAEGMKNIKNRNIITFHEAFPYFAKEFDLNIVAVVEREPGSEPSAKELSELIGEIKKINATAIFAEPQYSANSAEVIAKETGIKVYNLDPAVIGPFEPDAYIKIMEENLKTLQEALH